MSRIGRKPVDLPEKVKVSADGRMVSVSGPLGNLDTLMPEGVTLDISDKQVQVNAPAKKTRANAGFLGLGRALVANMVTGVTAGYEKNLLINGVGYRAELSGQKLTLSLGYSHQIILDMPEGIKCEVDKSQTKVKISGCNKQVVGNIAARIRSFKVAEPYKAKGVTYVGEQVRRKVGKAGSK